MRELLLRLLRLHDATVAERWATLWTGALFFCVMCAYYSLRPLREEIGSTFGTEHLIKLFTLTFVMVTVLNQPYMLLANRMPLRRLLPLVVHGFAASFLVIAGLFDRLPPITPHQFEWHRPECLLGAGFYSWVTTFVVFGVALVWVHAVDHFTAAQGKRLFSLVAVAGTLGAIAGSAVAKQDISRQAVILLVVGFLEVSLYCYRRSRLACERMVAERSAAVGASRIAGAGSWRGIGLVLRSPYLAGIAMFIVLSSVAATVFYYQLTGLADEQIPDTDERRSLFASINLWQNVLALGIQLTLTTPILMRLGVSAALCVMPVISLLGLASIAVHPIVTLLAVIDMVRRTLQFSVDKPAREVLYTPLGLEEKYKAKAFIDTSVLRLGDLIGAVLSDLLLAWRIGRDAMTAMAVPVFGLWALLGWWLGRQCRRRETAAVPPG